MEVTEAQVSAVATEPPEVAAEETPGVAAGLSKVAEQVEQALASLPPEVLTKLSNSPDYVEGIGPVYGDTLKGLGIDTLLVLLKQGATPKGRAGLAERSGISPKLILEWVNHVDLLEEAGVDTVVELATRNPANLFQKLTAVSEEKKLVRRPPAQSQVEDWATQAKQLPRVINY